MHDVARTQEELLNRQVQQDLFQRGLDLMNDAAAAGFVMKMCMPTTQQQVVYKSRDFLMVAPAAGQGQTLLHPNPKTDGPYR
jgi:hypothetical protein